MDQPAGQVTELTPEEQLVVEEERKRAGEALDKLFAAANNKQALKLNVLETMSFAGFVLAMSQQNTWFAEQLNNQAQVLEEQSKKKGRLWRPKT